MDVSQIGPRAHEMSPYVVGVDGGNTKTIALVASLDGRILGAGRSGCSDMYAVPLGTALLAVEEAIQSAVSAAGMLATVPKAIEPAQLCRHSSVKRNAAMRRRAA